MKICAVTCTGGRPELFALCVRWVERQTMKPDLWLVVTDNGDIPQGLPDYAIHRHVAPLPPTEWRSRDSAPNYSLWQALLMVPPDHMAVVFEDDDWYRQDHIAISWRQVEERGHMVAYGDRVVRFHLPAMRWRKHRKPGASEGRVALRPDAIAPYCTSLLERPLWSGPTDGRYEELTTCGIKGAGCGLPGRAGATPMHEQPNLTGWWPDPGYRQLRGRLGDDADAYLSLLKPT